MTDNHESSSRERDCLIKFRDCATHSSSQSRQDIETLFHNGAGTNVESFECYRVCTRSDKVFEFSSCIDGVISACRTLSAANTLLNYPPNPFADIVVKIMVNRGKVLLMTYDDIAGKNKEHEDEVLIPMILINRVEVMEK